MEPANPVNKLLLFLSNYNPKKGAEFDSRDFIKWLRQTCKLDTQNEREWRYINQQVGQNKRLQNKEGLILFSPKPKTSAERQEKGSRKDANHHKTLYLVDLEACQNIAKIILDLSKNLKS